MPKQRMIHITLYITLSTILIFLGSLLLPSSRANLAYEDELTVGIVSFNSTWGDKAANLNKMKAYIEEAAAEHVNILVFPELALTGYSDEEKLNGKYLNGLRKDEKMHRQLAEHIPSLDALASCNQLSLLCEKYNMYVVYGLPEKDLHTGEVYNAAAIISPDGVEGTYRKLHPIEPETSWCSAGTSPFILDTPWGSVGISICYDTYAYPELARYYSAQGCRLILNPTASSKAYKGSTNDFSKWYWYYTNRLEGVVYTNNLFIASANLIGEEVPPSGITIAKNTFPGGSVIVGPSSSHSNIGLEYYGHKANNSNIKASPDVSGEGLYTASINLDNASLDVFMSPYYKATLYEKWYTQLATTPKPPLYSDKVSVATTCLTPIVGNKAANLEMIKKAIQSAGEKGASLIIFPEMALTGAGVVSEQGKALNKSLAEPVPGPSTYALTSLCKRYNLYVVIGLPQKDEAGKLYNALAVIGPEGIKGVYQKINLCQEERTAFTAGSTPYILETSFGKFGLCMDNEWSTELARYYAGMGCQVIINGTTDSLTPHTYASLTKYKSELEYVADTNDLFIMTTSSSSLFTTIIGPKFSAYGPSKHVSKNKYFVDYYGTPLLENKNVLFETLNLAKASCGSLYQIEPSKMALYANWYKALKLHP